MTSPNVRMNKLDIQVYGFVIARDGELTQAEVEDQIIYSRFEVRRSVEKLLALRKLELRESSTATSWRTTLWVVKNAPRRERVSGATLASEDPLSSKMNVDAAALRHALGCSYAPLRNAASEVLYRARQASKTLTGMANQLGITNDTLKRIKREFPAEWENNGFAPTKMNRIV